jgi:hypothetical protein
MKLKISMILVFIALFAVILTGAFAAEIGRITFIDGRVDILKEGMDLAVPVDVDASVSNNDVIRTKGDSRAEITLSDGTRVRLARQSRLEFTDPGTLNLFRGKVRVMKDKVEAVQVITPNAIADARGKDFYFIYEKESSWFYSDDGLIETTGKRRFEEALMVEDDNCVRVVWGQPMKNSCVFKPVDAQKHAWDTATIESTPVVAQLPTEGEVYTYTPLGGRALDTPSLPVSIAFEDLVCTQCPPLALPPVPEIETIKHGDFQRLDDPCPICQSRDFLRPQ